MELSTESKLKQQIKAHTQYIHYKAKTYLKKTKMEPFHMPSDDYVEKSIEYHIVYYCTYNVHPQINKSIFSQVITHYNLAFQPNNNLRHA